MSGAGIAVLQSLPNAPRGDANLMAPRGKVDAGAAGLRASGKINIAALEIVEHRHADDCKQRGRRKESRGPVTVGFQ
jgi:hypothetical protein